MNGFSWYFDKGVHNYTEENSHGELVATMRTQRLESRREST